jgi:ATP-dependent helicase/nuclease subunit A
MTTPEPPDQGARRRAIENESLNLLLQAGAGSGKTTTLIDRLAWLLSERGADLSRIVAITFTEKAAGELKQRLRERCNQRADEAARSGAWDELDRWRTHSRAIDMAHVGTIHSFCARLLRSHAIRLGIDPLAEVVDDAQAQLLLRDTLRHCVLEALRSSSPHAQALLAAFGLTRLVNALALAVSRRAELRPEALPSSPEEVLARWRGAQAEAERAVVARLRAGPGLRAAADLLQRTEPSDAQDKLALARTQALEEVRGAFDEGLDPSEAVVHWRALADLPKTGRAGRKENWREGTIDLVREAIAALKAGAEEAGRLVPVDDALEPSAAELTAHFHSLLPEALSAYADAKRERSAVDFDDQLLLACALLRDHPDVCRAEQQRFEYILVDEFQDTDPVQREIIWRLAGGPEALTPGKLLLVGDAKQSIYAFRGADVTIYNDTRIRFEAEEDDTSATLSLTANFRSQARLVSFYNTLFAHEAVMGPDRPGRAAYEAHYEELLATRPPAGDGADVSFLLAIDAEANLEELRVRAADGIARQVAEAVRGGTVRVAERAERGEETWRPAQWQDVMVLLPTMSNVALYERALREHRVPYYVVAGRGFYARPEIMDVIALLKATDEPRDGISLARVLRAPWCGVSDEGLYWLARDGGLAKGLSTLGSGEPPADSPLAHLNPADAERAQRAAALLTNLRAVRDHLPLGELIERVLDETALPAMVAPRFDGARAYANLRKLVETARSFEAAGPVLLSRFVEHVETLRLDEIHQGEAPAEEEQGNAVMLMTIHKAKGLQRPIVVVADLARGGRPGRAGPVVLHPEVGPVLRGETADGRMVFPPIGDAALEETAAREAAERRRLLYVALTRAGDRLVISTPVKLDREGRPSGGVWVDALFAAFGEALLTEDRVSGADWSGEVIRLGPLAAPEGGSAVVPLLRLAWSDIAAGNPLPGGDDAEEAAILARMAPIAPDLAARTRFTVTELAHYLACPRRYGLAHVRGLAPFVRLRESLAPGRLRADERGNVVHRALQRLGRGPVSDLREEVQAALRECGLVGHEPGESEEIVATLVRFTGSATWEMVRTAKELRSEVPVIAPLGNALIEGQIDALVRDWDEQLHVIDYKTGRAGDSGTREEHRFQVGAYAALIEQARGRLPTTIVVHYLDADERLGIDPASEAKAATQRATDAIAAIRAGDFPRKAECEREGCPYSWVCGA